MAKVTQIILQGRTGRMGAEIENLLLTNKEAKLIGGFDSKEKPPKGAVLIDFSSPAGMRRSLAWSVKYNISFVSGTTGISAKDQKLLRAASKKIPVLWSPNMSVGINIFLKLIKAMGKNLQDFDLQIEEYHHSRKKDSPSGTAKILQEAAEKHGQLKMPPILAGRGGGIIGNHKMVLMAAEETLSIEHVAIQRCVFARGAISCAIWLKQQGPGLYSMQDVLSE